LTPPLEERWRRLRRAARADADTQTEQIAAVPDDRRVLAEISTIVPAGASDGITNLIKVTWRGGEVTCAGWNAAQTFAEGQWVMCDLLGDHQLFADYPIVGQP
jgi:hypothetical protein